MTTVDPMARDRGARLLALDTGSPQVSIALSVAGRVIEERGVEQSRSSAELLRLLDDCLRAAGLRPADLTALVVLRGPGSFTGVRIGLATVYGLHTALGTPVAVLPTLLVLAAHARERRAGDAARGHAWASAVDALRGEWFAQVFDAPSDDQPLVARAPAAIVSAAALAEAVPATVCGFGVSAIAERDRWPATSAPLEPSSLASTAARLAPTRSEVWDPRLLTQPLYLREPAVTLPAR